MALNPSCVGSTLMTWSPPEAPSSLYNLTGDCDFSELGVEGDKSIQSTVLSNIPFLDGFD